MAGGYLPSSNTFFCEFQRSTLVNDGFHVDLDIYKTQPMIWGFNPQSGRNAGGKPFTYHGEQHRGTLAASLASGAILQVDSPNLDSKVAHGVGMGSTFLIIFPFAVFYAR